jgi:hypothetical protein
MMRGRDATDDPLRVGRWSLSKETTMKTILGNYEIMSRGDNAGRSPLRYVGQDPETAEIIRAIMSGDASGIPENIREAAMKGILANSGLVLKETQPTAARTFPLGFISNGAVPAGASVTIVSRPQVLFKGMRLVVPSDVAGDFSIDDVKVGKNSQFVAEGAIPARILQENAVDVGFELDTAQISQDVTLSVTNISGVARVFRAGLIGRAAE